MIKSLKQKRNYVSGSISNLQMYNVRSAVVRIRFILIDNFAFYIIEKRKDFERRRKLHYNEFEAVLRARELMEQDEDENEDEQIEIDETSK